MTAESKKDETPKEAGTVYWAQASDYQLGNWRVETKDGIIVREITPLRFSENIYIAKTQEECDFIEGKLERNQHNAFTNGQIVKCRDLAHARELSALRSKKKQITHFDSEVISNKTFDHKGREVASTG
jgi:hypothetical protein